MGNRSTQVISINHCKIDAQTLSGYTNVIASCLQLSPPTLLTEERSRQRLQVDGTLHLTPLHYCKTLSTPDPDRVVLQETKLRQVNLVRTSNVFSNLLLTPGITGLSILPPAYTPPSVNTVPAYSTTERYRPNLPPSGSQGSGHVDDIIASRLPHRGQTPTAPLVSSVNHSPRHDARRGNPTRPLTQDTAIVQPVSVNVLEPGITEWEKDRRAGLSLEERVKREYDRKIQSESNPESAKKSNVIRIASSQLTQAAKLKKSQPHHKEEGALHPPTFPAKLPETGGSSRPGPSIANSTLNPTSPTPTRLAIATQAIPLRPNSYQGSPSTHQGRPGNTRSVSDVMGGTSVSYGNDPRPVTGRSTHDFLSFAGPSHGQGTLRDPFGDEYAITSSGSVQGSPHLFQSPSPIFVASVASTSSPGLSPPRNTLTPEIHSPHPPFPSVSNSPPVTSMTRPLRQDSFEVTDLDLLLARMGDAEISNGSSYEVKFASSTSSQMAYADRFRSSPRWQRYSARDISEPKLLNHSKRCKLE